jgi:multidrug resistance efflux pump
VDSSDWDARVSGSVGSGGNYGTNGLVSSSLASTFVFCRLGRPLYLSHRARIPAMKARLLNYFVTLVVVVLAGGAAFALYQQYIANPWTRDGQVRANIVGIAPRVSGPIIRIPVRDNQQVKKGDLLFEIDPADFSAQVDIANGQLLNDEANLKQRRQDLDRQSDLYRQHVTALQDFQNAQDAYSAAEALVASARANLELAKLNLGYTRVMAPVDGYVTNMNTSEGTYVTAGVQLLALVDTSSFWVAAYFKETQLPHIQIGQKAKLTIMGYSNDPFLGVVRSIGWGIFVQDGSAGTGSGLLPSVNPTVDWVRLPQRFPVRIHVEGQPPVPLRIGQTVSVAMLPEVEAPQEAKPDVTARP